MRIAVLGAGYVGLVSGACLADFGHFVTCVDLDIGKVERLRRGEIPIYEPGLDELVAHNVQSGRLAFTTDFAAAVAEADVVFIAVGTPPRKGDGHADLSYVYGAAAAIADAMKGFTVIVTKSTVPVGTGDEVERIIRDINPAAEFAVVSNPEFLREGAAIADFKEPDRVVVGVEDERAKAVMSEVYRPLSTVAPLVFVSRRSSELIKYASNGFLAVKIAYINEMADLCEATGADVMDVAHGIGLDKRIGSRFLNAGPGYGGSCFPKDTLALMKAARDHGSPVSLIEATVTANDNRKRAMARKVVAACGGDVRNKTVAILGLTFKPDTDDMRESPAISIIQALQDRGARIVAYDPQGMEAAAGILDGVEFRDDAYEVAPNADVAVVVTEWDEFKALDLARFGGMMRHKVLVDLRNIYRVEDVAHHGFRYASLGRSDLVVSQPMMNAAE